MTVRQEKSERSAVLHKSAVRVGVMIIVGLAAAAVAGALGFWSTAGLIGWISAVCVYTCWVWSRIYGLNPSDTATHATAEDPSRSVSEILILLASLANIGAVVAVTIGASDSPGFRRVGIAALGLASLALSWILVNTLYMLRYASLYYRGTEGGIDFSQDAGPTYLDFAYVAFTIGMTYQVSDTTFRTTSFRSAALPHALLSYLFGAVILASTINLVVGIANR